MAYDPSLPSNAYLAQSSKWNLIQNLLGGTDQLRLQGQTYLPMFPHEPLDAYTKRLSQAVLTPWFARMCQVPAGIICRKQLTWNDLNPALKTDWDNINLLGQDTNIVRQELLLSGIQYGVVGVFVSFPSADPNRTVAQAKNSVERPHWVIVEAPNIIAARPGKPRKVGKRGLVNSLAHLRLREISNEQKEGEEYVEVTVERIREFNASDEGVFMKVHKRVDGGEWALEIEERKLDIEVIPFAFLNLKPATHYTASPPMLEIGHLNIKHYQMTADLDSSIHIASHPTLFLFGLTDAKRSKGLTLGPHYPILMDIGGRAEWISAEMKNFEAATYRIKELEVQMATLGMSAIAATKLAAETARAKEIDRVQSDSELYSVAQLLQDCLDEAAHYHAMWVGVDAPECLVSRDFLGYLLDPATIKTLSDALSLNQISLETFITILSKNDILPDTIEVQEEIDRVNGQQEDAVERDTEQFRETSDIERDNAIELAKVAQRGKPGTKTPA